MRVDLGDFAGQSDLKLRFDFSTAGRMLTAVGIGSPYANLNSSIEGHGSLTDERRGQNNAYEGFYIDDIIIGFAERGEMVTAASGTTTHFTLPSQTPELGDPWEQVTGAYQLEIRRGSEYADNVTARTADIFILEQFDTNDRLIPEKTLDGKHWVNGMYVGSYRGDENVVRQQDQLMIEANTIRDVLNTGILVGPGGRDGTDVPQPGSVINTPVLNNADLAPGVVIMNNVVANFGDTGILFSGDSNRIGDPIVPFGRIVNNTIAGTSTAISDYGIRVVNYASPTILNNIITTTNRGILIDGTSSSTVFNYNLFQGNATNGTNATFDISLAAGQPLFVDRANYNFYLASGSRAIDSSIDSLADRSAMWPGVKEPLGIPPSPIITPARDRYAQLRDDDPNQAPPSGMGTNIFKDRGAIERADFTGPTAWIVDPLDNTVPRDGTTPKADGFYDYNAADHDVVVINQKTTDFAVQLLDAGGIGIDDLTVTLSDRVTVRTNVVKVYRVLDLAEFSTTPEADWPTLRLGADYLLDWDAANNILHVIPASGIWQPGYYYAIDVNNTQVRDLAGNPLQPNRSAAPFAGKTLFTVHLTGLDFGDLPDDPAGASARLRDAAGERPSRRPGRPAARGHRRRPSRLAADGRARRGRQRRCRR